MSISVGDAGAWKSAYKMWVGDGGVYKPVLKAWVGEGGVWKPFFNPPTYWNKLESDSSTTSPMLGTAGSVTGTPTYTTGKFGNSYVGTNGAYLAWNGASHLPSDGSKGCYEFWYYPTTGYDSVTNWLSYIFNNVSGGAHISIVSLGASGLQFVYQQRGSGIITMSHIEPLTSFTINTWYHLALTWDSAGLAGTSEKVRAYIDGVQKNTPVTGTLTLGAITNNTTAIGNSRTATGDYCRGRIDNFKAYNFGKTDFSDRNNEGI